MAIHIRRSAATLAGFYPAGHWAPARQALRAVYPRPSAETPSWARYKWAYFDGVNPVEFELEVGILGGAWPYVLDLDGPPGMTVGTYYGHPNHCVIRWTPESEFVDEPVVLTVLDQNMSPLQLSWTISTSAAINVGGMFIFLHENGDDSLGDGSYDDPFETHLKLFGASAGSVTYPNKIVYRRGGTFPVYAQNSFGIELRKDCSPMSLLNFPGETVVLDLSNAGTSAAFSVSGSNGSDAYIRGVEYSGGPSTTNFQHHSWGGLCHRISAINVRAPNVKSSGSSVNNETLNWMDSSGGLRQYPYFRGLYESNRGSANGGGGFVAFGVQYLLAEHCTFEGSTAGVDMCLKASAQDCELREFLIVRSDGGQSLGTICQDDVGANIQTRNIHIRHGRVKTGGASDGGVDANMYFNTNAGQHWIDRVSVDGGAINVNEDCPVDINSCAIQVGGGHNAVKVDHTNAAPGPNVTVTNDECHSPPTTGILDASGNLTPAYAEFDGTSNSRGARIA